MIKESDILKILPYKEPFLFVDSLDSFDKDELKGHYTFRKDEYFYEGHFVDNPVTPGVILNECMAQIGLVCLGIVNLGNSLTNELKFGLTNSSIDYLKPVFPGTKVTVVSKKVYFRFNKLKCNVQMIDNQGDVVAKGTISGMIVEKKIDE